MLKEDNTLQAFKLISVCYDLTSLPCTMRWCVVIRALKTTTQLALPTLSISVSAIWGTFTLVSWVAWIRSEGQRGEEGDRRGQVVDVSRRDIIQTELKAFRLHKRGGGRQMGEKWRGGVMILHLGFSTVHTLNFYFSLSSITSIVSSSKHNTCEPAILKRL